MSYAELHCLSAFSFQRGASTADELFARAQHHGYKALAITDECSLAGIVRALRASEACGLPLIVGSEMQLADGPRLVLLVEDAAGYQSLCWLITRARRRAEKGEYQLLAEDLEQVDRSGLLALWLPPPQPEMAQGQRVRGWFPDRCWIAVELHHGADDAGRLQQLRALGDSLQLPLVAAGDVHMHARGRRALQDVMTAIRHRVTVAEAGHLLFANGERHLRPLAALQAIYPPDLLQETLQVAARCSGFNLKQAVNYQYPSELVPDGHTPQSWLAELVVQGARRRWPEGTRAQAQALIDKELVLIAKKQYASYFLTVHDLVRHARELGILCQGRGSAANSVVCFVLGITELDPSHSHLLFERFISEDRDEPPDIDVDFEHERREEVIQYVFSRYGRERAALAAVATQYGGRGAIRDVARVLGMPGDAITQLTSCIGQWSDSIPGDGLLREHGFDPDSPLLRRILVLAGELIDFPHYLSQHPGGFVISERALHSMVPVENAAMDARTVIQWDKDDLEYLGLMKVDVLALGMLTAVRRCFDLIQRHRGLHYTLATIPQEDKDTYDMISRADTVGVFQIESRAQMAMLPRLQPRTFYDLVIEVAIVRPGPIQGDMVHPYLRRRRKEEPISYPSAALEAVLKRTLGVPLFQEQVMQIAMVAADYSASEADALRRSMAAWKRHGGLEHHRERLTAGMLKNGYDQSFADRIFEQIKGFGSYGFPESHAASFALIAYASSWLKCHHPAAFACALLNSQPMGFYSPDQLLQDVRRHGVATRPLDVRYSGWECSLEPEQDGRLAIRLGFCLVRGFSAEDAQRIEQARARTAFADIADLCRRAGLDTRARALLADSGALRGMAGHRHRARWAIAGVEDARPLFDDQPAIAEGSVALPMPSAGEDLAADYALLGTTLSRHPLARLRPQLKARHCRSSRDLEQMSSHGNVLVAGLVRGRQRPQTASGVTFITLEDEFGQINVVVWRQLAERQRQVFLESRLMQVRGRLEAENGVRHLIAKRMDDLTALLGSLDVRSRDFH
ncbi:error-prone DNA polymerase [Stenotrophomonas sp.]|uniref:error-prone DNA polymerase n=1 Tax=Stenotrophomonas sp. TaxID=69392 RepID=UPI0028B07466|nr:error-prone DNA polymerase [Stenotrophomonas sp.]